MGLFRDERKAYVNLGLIFLNIAYFLVVDLSGSSQSIAHVLKMGGLTAEGILAEHRYYLLLTSMFMHWGISHLINNMVVLFVLGDNLERALGHIKYLLFYLLCGIGSGLISVFYYEWQGENVVSVGASGAIFGVIGGLLCIVIRCRGRLEDLTSRQLLFLILFSLYHGLTSSGINNAAHLGGLITGFLLAFLFYRVPKRQEDRW